MNISNKLTVFRMILVPILILFLLWDVISYRFIISMIIFIIASISDHFDGKLARKYNQITDFGKFLDPLADKILVMSAFICFIELRFIHAIPVIILLMREFLITSLRLVAKDSGKVISANIWGKVKTVSQIVAIIIILSSACSYELFGINFYYDYKNIFFIINEFSIWISVIFSILSAIIYMKNNIEFISNK